MLSEREARRRLDLDDGETLLVAFEPEGSGAGTLTLGLYRFWRKAAIFALTDQRVIARKGLVFRRRRTLSLTSIEHAAVYDGPFTAQVIISTTDGTPGVKLGPLYAESARVLADRIIRAVYLRGTSPR